MPRSISPIGSTAAEAAARRAAWDPAYRAERGRTAQFHGIAKLVIHRRAILRVSQSELARRVGTSVPAISRLESGRHSTNVQTLHRVFAALGGRLVLGYEVRARAHAKRHVVTL